MIENQVKVKQRGNEIRQSILDHVHENRFEEEIDRIELSSTDRIELSRLD